MPRRVVRAALGHDVDNAAGGLAELGFVSARLDLDFLHEVERRAVAERAKDDRIRAERAVALVGDVHAVDDVLILEAAGAGNRRVARCRRCRRVLTPGAMYSVSLNRRAHTGRRLRSALSMLAPIDMDECR